jgi:solute carrier family 34 (sodium-dependent phosphate cotransporter)
MKLPDYKKLPSVIRIVVFVAGLYVFLLSIELMGVGFKGLGSGFTRTLFALTATPLTGLFIGLLVTSICQSSSSTTSVVVGLVASGTLDITHAIPIVMGANIGTTVTSTIVAFAHIGRRQEFERAFPAAMVHDIFNVLTVLTLMPLEAAFHPLARGSALLARTFQGVGGLSVSSPLQFVTGPPLDGISRLTGHIAWIELAVALVLLFGALKVMVDMLRSLVSRRFEVILDKYLFGNAGRAFLLGLFFTALVQSSSVTVSMAVPLAGAGLLTLRQLFPYALGANIGTTITAVLAALVTGSVAAVQVAFAHTLFNSLGAMVWYPLRIVPLTLASRIGGFCARHRAFAVAAVIVVFFAIPLVAVILLRRTS